MVSTAATSVRPHFSGYVKIGKTVEPKNQYVRLHYGKARVFVRPNEGAEVKLNAEIFEKE